MELRKINFGHVFSASGSRNFFGDGWWYHKFLKPFGLNYEGSTFVTKTITLKPRIGNMFLSGTIPKEYFPACVKVYPSKGAAVNAVGLSNPGIEWILNQGKLQELNYPFLLSFMAVETFSPLRAEETKRFVDILSKHSFKAKFGLQLNFSCPNAGVDYQSNLCELNSILNVCGELNIPIVLKVNSLFPIHLVKEIAGKVDAVSVSNTIPWDKLEPVLRKKYFGTTESPLEHLGGGGISGAPLLEKTLNWLQQADSAGVKIPIIAGGGILSKKDAEKVLMHGAKAIEVGSVSFLRPWRVRGMIRHANQIARRMSR